MKGSVVYADGKIIFRNEQGPVVMLEANPRDYKELGRFDQPDRSSRPAWSHPVIADGKLYLRDMDKLLVYNLKAAN
jgi:outer membrane protein assembly factor BamB